MKIRGTLTIVDAAAHDYEFRAQRSTGVSTQQVVKTAGQSKLYRTTGERQPKMVAHLSVSADAAAPAAELQEQLSRVTAGMATKRQPRLRGRTLLSADGTRVTLNQQSGEVECVLRFAGADRQNLQETLIKRMQQISTCFAINNALLAPLSR